MEQAEISWLQPAGVIDLNLALTETHMDEQHIKIRVADALDQMQGIEQAVAYHRFLGDYSYEQISDDLQISSQEAAKIAAAGLMQIKQYVFGK